MRTPIEETVYGHDGNLPLTKANWKCANCLRFKTQDTPCFSDHLGPGTPLVTIKPKKELEPSDSCELYMEPSLFSTPSDQEEQQDDTPDNHVAVVNEDEYEALKNRLFESANNLHNKISQAFDNEENYTVNANIPNTIEVKREGNGKTYTATVVLEEDWDNDMKEIAIEKAKEELDKKIMSDKIILQESQKYQEPKQLDYKENSTTPSLSDNDIEVMKDLKKTLDSLINKESEPKANKELEQTLEGDIKIGWFNQSTTWQRVMNAARRTIGKKPLEKEPSDSWKAKILLAEHSPIRLLEYDWGWEKIRQWVSVHLVRHHVGVEKFVHSQRSDRRELPCDRDHLYQGARNDMDMTANAQGLINMSRKRCCNCASTETREAWKLVLDELEKKDPIMRAKCVRECVYRGFCPEWMSKCGYYKTDAFKKERAAYVNTLYGNDVKYYYYPATKYLVSNTGHVYKTTSLLNGGIISDNSILEDLIEVEYEREWINGHYNIKIKEGYNCSVDKLIFNAFNTNEQFADEYEILHIDGNEWNNNINNLKLVKK